MRIRRCRDRVEKVHVQDVVQIYFLLEYYHESLSIQSHCKYSGREREFTDSRGSLCGKLAQASRRENWGGDLRSLTFVFRITRRRGDKTRATREVENIISIIETLSSSLLKAGRNSGSLW